MFGTAALIISGIISAAGAITTSAMANKSQKDAKKEAKDLAMIARGDELDAQNKNFALSEQKLGLEKEALGLSKIKTNFEMQQIKKANNATQLSNLSSALSATAKKDQSMTNFILSLYGKTGVK